MGTNVAAAHPQDVAPPASQPAVAAVPDEGVGRTLMSARAVAEAAERLAAPSSVVTSVLELLDNESAAARAIGQRVAQSPEISAHVMRVANSALFGEPVDSIDRAIVRLGHRSLRGLLLAASTYKLLEAGLRIYSLPRLALFSHSNDVAQMAQTIASQVSPAHAPAAYLAGLLHDIGKPILADVARANPDLPAVRSTAEERHVFGTDHALVGQWIARRWSLPEDMCDAIGTHHAADPPEGEVARAVWLADVVVHARQGMAAANAHLTEAAVACGVATDTLESILTEGDQENAAPKKPSGLTDREMQVLRLLATGAAAKQVAQDLGCSVSTVHNHLHHVYRKLNVTGQAQALLMAREMGWV